MEKAEIDLIEIVKILFARGRFIVITALALAVLVAAYSLTMPNVYRTQIVLQLVEEDNDLGALQGLASQFGGLANLAGVNLSSGGSNDIAKQVLQTRQFILSFIERHDIAAQLLAVDGWSRGDNSLSYDGDIYDAVKKQWLIEGDDGKPRTPTDDELYEKFSTSLVVSSDIESGLVNISFEHISPVLAKDWLGWMIKDLNEQLKNKMLRETSRRIEYLEEQINSTQVANIRSIFYQLVEKEYQDKMLVETKDEFVFKVIDPAYVPDKKAHPRRALLTIFSFIMGLFLASAFVLITQNRRNV